MNFRQLSDIIKQTNETFYRQFVKAVNINLTLRNWLFGFYIVEFEQSGTDRAKYGNKLLQNLADKLSIKGLTPPELSRCRQFYNTYPQILGLSTQKFKNKEAKELLPAGIIMKKLILGSVTQKLKDAEIKHLVEIIKSISYTHFTELIKIDDPLKRRYFELLILKTQPSVKELKRQINTLSYERLGLSKNKNTSFEQITKKITPAKSTDLIKSHYLFDFLKISNHRLIEETELEQALIDHLQNFIIELGYGFCFEARQKRILIGDEYFYIDLVFYHRILKCHVLIELKTENVKHEHIGQLKVYLQHYKRNVTAADDNPPIGILLVTDKNNTLVEYAVADSDQKLFVSKYMLQLPSKEVLRKFINDELKKV
jgi:predicted nuclease of restriction endonuclease-like (RecB) superfamily